MKIGDMSRIQAAVEATPVNCSTKPMRVLVVDDNVVNRKVLTRIINKHGVSCSEAENGEEAVRMYQSFQPELIFMDLQMPIMDGFQASATIRSLETDSCVPIYAVSGYARDDYKSKAIEVGMQGYIVKPIDAKVILETMKRHFKL
jgi:CheY-like chemotaxis protein